MEGFKLIGVPRLIFFLLFFTEPADIKTHCKCGRQFVQEKDGRPCDSQC